MQPPAPPPPPRTPDPFPTPMKLLRRIMALAELTITTYRYHPRTRKDSSKTKHGKDNECCFVKRFSVRIDHTMFNHICCPPIYSQSI